MVLMSLTRWITSVLPHSFFDRVALLFCVGDET